jgi:hypothetical protein
MRLRSLVAAVLTATLITSMSAVAADAAAPVGIARIQYDSPGNDTGSNKSLNAEWVKITNHSKAKKVLTGWTLRDAQKHVYRFPKFTLGAGASVWVHTGSGSNTGRHLYWGEDYYVWNNTGDKAILKNTSGTTVDTCTWRDKSTRDKIYAIGC